MKSQRHSQLSAQVPAFLVAAAVIAAGPPAAGTPAPDEATYTDEQRITAVDALVEVVTRKGRGTGAASGLPAFLLPEDFAVTDAGEPRQVIDVGAFGPAQHVPDSEPWTFVIYFDRALSGPAEASWAAGELVQAAERLTDLGRVSVVVADPEPETILDPTRDAELLGSVLAEIALFPEGEDHKLLALRDEFLAEAAKPDSEIDLGELAAFAAAEERRIVVRQLDALLTHMASLAAGARRGLFLAASGFDLHPEEFYRSRRGSSGLDLEAVAEALERSLTAYGWITFPLLPPAEETRTAGFRLGKWHLGAPRGDTRETVVDPLHPEETVAQGMINLLDLTRSGERDLEKADAYLELAESLSAQADHGEAEQALRMALHHLADDPATTGRQVKALLGLGRVLELQGRRREARAAFEKARELDAESVAAAEVPLGELADPTGALESLAEATGAAVVASREDLQEALAALAYRVRVTFQVSGAPDGSLHPVEIRCLRKGCRVRAPAWIRSGTPREVAASRIRRWLADDQFEGDFQVEARFARGGGIEISAVPESPAGREPVLRITVGHGDPESIGELRQWLEAPGRLSDPPRWSFRIEPFQDRGEVPPGAVVAIAVDHLESGRWGATLLEAAEEVSD